MPTIVQRDTERVRQLQLLHSHHPLMSYGNGSTIAHRLLPLVYWAVIDPIAWVRVARSSLSVRDLPHLSLKGFRVMGTEGHCPKRNPRAVSSFPAIASHMGGVAGS